MHLRHLNKKAKTYSYEVILHDVTELSTLLSPPPPLPVAAPFHLADPFVLSIHSRSKQNQTRVSVLHSSSSSSSILFDESLSFTSTLFLSSHPNPKFDPKPFTFTLTNVRLQQERLRRFMQHSATLDLARFASPSGDETEQAHTLPLVAERGGVDGIRGPELRLTVRSKYVGEAAANETSLLSAVSRGSRSGTSSSHMRGLDEHSRLRRWKDRGEEKQEEEEVAMRRKDREDDAGDADPHYRLTLDMAEDEEEKKPTPPAQEGREGEDALRRAERRRTFDANDLFRSESKKKLPQSTPASLTDILPALRSPSPSDLLPHSSPLSPPSPQRNQSLGPSHPSPSDPQHPQPKKPLKKSLSASSTSSAASTASSSSSAPRPPAAVVGPARANIHIPPMYGDAAEREEHERRYRQRVEPRVEWTLGLVLAEGLFTSSGFYTAVTGLGSLPQSACVFIGAFETLQQQEELEEERRADERQRWLQAEEQRRWLQFTSKEKRRWQSQREQDRGDLERLRREDEQRKARRDRDETEHQRRHHEHSVMTDELKAVATRWYFFQHPIAGVTLYRLLVLTHAFHTDTEDREVDVEDDGSRPDRRGKKKKPRLKQPATRTVQVITARRPWIIEAVLRALRRRVEEARDHYGRLLWLINATVMLHRCVLRQRDQQEGEVGDRAHVLSVRVHDFGVSFPVNGKQPIRTGPEAPLDGPSSSTAFIPRYPFVSDAVGFDYGGSGLSGSLSPLSFFVHHVRGLLLALFSLLLYHLSFALSYRVPLAAILSPVSFALETVLDLLSDTHQLMELSQVRQEIRAPILVWMMQTIAARITNAVLFEFQRALGAADDADAAAYELPLAPPVIQRAGTAGRKAGVSASQPVIAAAVPDGLFVDAASFLGLGMRLMMIVSALRDWMTRHGYAVDLLNEPLAPLHSLAMLCLAEKRPGSRRWRAECPGLSDAQVGAVLALYERVGGERVGDAWRAKGRAGQANAGAVWVEWPGEVELRLDWPVVPFAAASVGLPPGMREADASKQVDGLLDADGLLIT